MAQAGLSLWSVQKRCVSALLLQGIVATCGMLLLAAWAELLLQCSPPAGKLETTQRVFFTGSRKLSKWGSDVNFLNLLIHPS